MLMLLVGCPCYLADSADSDEIAPVFVHSVSLDSLPLSSASVAAATRKDPLLSRVLDYTAFGWPEVPRSDELYPYFFHQSELSMEDGCLL